jgi:hypothetical protein
MATVKPARFYNLLLSEVNKLKYCFIDWLKIIKNAV